MRLLPILLVALLAQISQAQTPDTSRIVKGATVSGVVHDSIARLPMAGATVQIVAADNPARFGRSAISDWLGRYTIRDIPEGRYTMGFFHPMLDSLGVEAPLREVYVDGHEPVRADLGVPSPARLRAVICGIKSKQDSGAVIVGVVRDARSGEPAAGVTVTGEWLELSFTPDGIVRRFPHLVAKTGDNGWFAICNVPRTGTMALLASRGADSTDLIDVQVPADGFMRHELYLGRARTVVTADTSHREMLGAPPRGLHIGDEHLNGTVVTALDGRPVANAQISIVNGPQTRANDQGEWTLADAPVGTRMLEARALGYYPEKRSVHVVPGAAPIRFALSTLKSVLDTIRISASRRYFDRDTNGFQRRRRTGAGTYITAEQLERIAPPMMSDVLRMVPGITLEEDVAHEVRPMMHGSYGLCSPAIYLDGVNVSDEAIDTWVHPSEIAAMEVYSEASAPAEYQRMNGCGAILFWTKPIQAKPSKR